MAYDIHSVLADLRAQATSTRDLGDRFERLIRAYLLADPLYASRFAQVWMWQDWPGRNGEGDTGIDLVAAEHDGGVCAIQCKFYDPSHTLDKSDIDSFFTASGKAPFTSRLVVSTTDRWTGNAEKALDGQQIPVQRLRVQDLAQSPIDWTAFRPSRPDDLRRGARKTLKPHQRDACDEVRTTLRERGRLIMACGTGKTFTSLRIAEAYANDVSGRPARVLFLVPSISLLSQTLREWSAEAELSLHAVAVCSDTKVSKKVEDISVHDLAAPATTVPERIVQIAQRGADARMVVVFSTYQSIEAVHQAQAAGLGDFDLVICDEAHRTTGVTLAGEDESQFVRVHDAAYIRATRRLYMTATPRVFNDSTKVKADGANALLCSMDDEAVYGPELHRLGFGKAVAQGLLTDYRVMVLAVSEEYVAARFQQQLADSDHELTLDDAVKIVGCWNGLTRRSASGEVEGPPMRRAVAFCQNIAASKKITELFEQVTADLAAASDDDEPLCQAHHVDGTFNALRRNAELDWLKRDLPAGDHTVRVLANARCLSEGVDVPALDAVMFLNPRRSVVDVVQSVGRVMRLAEGKDYGYIILPIGIPAGMEPEEALRDNRRYQVVWEVLQALRAHDDRFNATINTIELSTARPESIRVIGVPGGDGREGAGAGGDDTQMPLPLVFDEWRDAIYARIVQKCGDRQYWERWAADIAQIAERHTARMTTALADPHAPGSVAFAAFVDELRADINPHITHDDAVEMLSQHLITKPVFDALFDGYAFADHNPVSQTMQRMLDALRGEALQKETETLEGFYADVRLRAAGVDSDLGRQRIITELYEKFFRTAFPKMADRLGIVYTPIEIVDFIIASVQRVLVDEFGTELGAPGVHILDPFTGTGTFLARLLQSGAIPDNDLERKFRHELHANEIVLLAYYIAAINIEAAFHARHGGDYQAFPGIVLTDTFQLAETPTEVDALMTPPNHARVEAQQAAEIRVILGNPPYSVGQGAENDGNKNLVYPALDTAIRESYVRQSQAQLKRNLYDSYVRAIRWASDRIGSSGVVAFVTNGYFIDGGSQDGLRKCLADEFTSIHCLNLRGNATGKLGEERRREGGGVFGEGSRAPVAITLLVKNGEPTGAARIRYHDIGDYLAREQKLALVKGFGSVGGVEWADVTPNAAGDWINQRDSAFSDLAPLAGEGDIPGLFQLHSQGICTNRDAWVYNFDRSEVEASVARTVVAFNSQVAAFGPYAAGWPTIKPGNLVEGFIDTDPRRISWTRRLKRRLAMRQSMHLRPDRFFEGAYRPFCLQSVYFDPDLNETVYQQRRIFPDRDAGNLAITVTGQGARRDFSALMVDALPNLHFQDSCQTFPRFTYSQEADDTLLAGSGAVRHDNIAPSVLNGFRARYDDPAITADDVFSYVYGVLHHPEYRRRYAAELRKMLPRLPMLTGFRPIAEAGRRLSDLHVGYESVEPHPLAEVGSGGPADPRERYRVRKMRFRAKGDRGAIVYNAYLTLEGIPERAYDYVVNGRPAIEWVMDRYQVRTDRDSGIVNDPNAYSDDPRYIVDLVARVVTVSLRTLDVVDALPPYVVLAEAR